MHKQTNKTEIIAYGNIIAIGTQSQPIFFTSNASSKAKKDWVGIRLISGSQVSQIKWAGVLYSESGISEELPNVATLANEYENNYYAYNENGLIIAHNGGYPTWANTTHNSYIKNSYFEYNTKGLVIGNCNGYGWSYANVTIENNVFDNNTKGIVSYGCSWWLGHTRNSAIIKWNTIQNSTEEGIYSYQQGPGDCSGYDTIVNDTITLNYLKQNTYGFRTSREGQTCYTTTNRNTTTLTTNTFDTSPGIYNDFGTPTLTDNNFTDDRSNGAGSTLNVLW